MESNTADDPKFPYSLTISVPFPNNRLASAAMRALQVDAELSQLVTRSFRLTTGSSNSATMENEEDKTVLETTYRATTNRMLRVSVNGFMDSLGVVLGVMHELDVDVLQEESRK
ncbi:hypothetical protein VTN31DRAFT_1535 [Thermomyces dupontii]|uniref:uncharacterized protein n=1 Tax=Talaromyces thermophilus TaxID=28565 RepID=UPI0037435126